MLRTPIYCLLFLLFNAKGIAQVKLKVVSESYQALMGVQLTFENGKTFFSDSLGMFKIPKELTIKSSKIVLKHADYEQLTDSLIANENKIFQLVLTAKSLNEVVVTAQIGTIKAENAVQKIKIITKETIDAKGAVNLADLLRNELNIRISQDQILGSGLTMKGVGGEGVKILIDGVPVIGRNDGNIDLSQINLANYERVEIVEGPLSVNFGSNAIAGTINLISKKKVKNGHEISLNSYYETSGHYNLNSAFSLTKGKHSLNFSFGRNYFDGWKDGDPAIEFPRSKPADSSRFKSWKPKEQFMASFRYQLKLKNVQINPFFEGFTEKIINRGYPRLPYQIVAFDDSYKTERLNFGTLLTAKISTNFHLKGQLGYNFYKRTKNTFVKDLTTLEQTLTATPGDQDTSTFDLLFTRLSFARISPNTNLKYEIGLELNHETGTGIRIAGGQKSIGDYALFSVVDWSINRKFTINPGLRWNSNTVYGSVVVPTLSLKYQAKKQTIRSSFAQGFRTPSIKELYLFFVDINHNIQGNEFLKPETSNHFQIWYTLKDSIKNSFFTFELNPYFQHIKNKISLAQTASLTLYSYFNIDVFNALGTQTNISFDWKNFQLRTGFAYIGIATNYTNNKFNYSPEITSSLHYTIPKTKLSLDIFYKYTGKVSSFILNDDGSIDPLFIANYQLLDAQFHYSFWKNKIRFNIGAKNILDVKNVNTINSGGTHSSGNSSVIGLGRTYYTALTLNL